MTEKPGYPEKAACQTLVREFADFDFPPRRVEEWLVVQAGSSETQDELLDRFAGSEARGSDVFIPLSD